MKRRGNQTQASTGHRPGRASGRAAVPVAPPLEPALLERMLYFMKLQRELEDRIERKLYRQGLVVGGVYVGRGQEAIGICSSLLSEPGDVLCPSHRDLGAFLVRGMSPRTVLAQYMGRVEGPTRGRDGNMHMGDLSLGIIAFISSMAAIIPVAGGAALAMRYRNQPNVVFCYFGDGATSRGDWHEGLNLAAVQKLPVVYVCNNNQYAYSTPIELQMPVKNVADRGPAYGMPAEVVDGNDPIAVYEATQRAVLHARSGLGPALIECKTFRMTGHSAHDAADYVPGELFAEWSAKDPINRLETLMRECGLLSDESLDPLNQRVAAEVDEAVEWAVNCPFPEPGTLLDGVYEQREEDKPHQAASATATSSEF